MIPDRFGRDICTIPQKEIFYYPRLKLVTGSIPAALVVYYYGTYFNCQDWFLLPLNSVATEEIGISENEYRTAKDGLKVRGFLEEKFTLTRESRRVLAKLDLSRIQIALDYYAENREEFVCVLSKRTGTRYSHDNQCSGWVYLFQSEDKQGRTLYKIGLSTNPELRLKQVERKIKKPVTLVHLIRCYDMAKTESALHKKYRNKHQGYEWFYLSDSDVKEICSMTGEV